MRRAAMAMMVGLMCSMPGLSAQAEEAAGVWMMDSGKVTVRIADCGASLCGTIVALKKPLDKKGRPKLDKENPNPALRGRRVIGLTILSNMKPTGENSWKGTIYNPDDGNTYSSRMMLKGANAMRVEGCVASLFCKTIKFTRIK